MLFGLRVRTFAHLQRLSLGYYEQHQAGKIMTRMTSDVEAFARHHAGHELRQHRRGDVDVRAGVAEDRVIVTRRQHRGDRRQRVDECLRKEDAEPGTDDGDDRGFGEQLRAEPEAARTERASYRELLGAHLGARERELREVRARHEQHEQEAREHRDGRGFQRARLDAVEHRRARRDHHARRAAVLCRAPGERGRERILRLRHRHALAQHWLGVDTHFDHAHRQVHQFTAVFGRGDQCLGRRKAEEVHE